MNDEIMELITKMYREWCRLKGYNIATKPIEVMIDEATGAEANKMREFVEWFSIEVLTRLPR